LMRRPQISTRGRPFETGRPQILIRGKEISSRRPQIMIRGREISTRRPQISMRGRRISSRPPRLTKSGRPVMTIRPPLEIPGAPAQVSSKDVGRLSSADQVFVTAWQRNCAFVAERKPAAASPASGKTSCSRVAQRPPRIGQASARTDPSSRPGERCSLHTSPVGPRKPAVDGSARSGGGGFLPNSRATFAKQSAARGGLEGPAPASTDPSMAGVVLPGGSADSAHAANLGTGTARKISSIRSSAEIP
jgi:hypothetical protein